MGFALNAFKRYQDTINNNDTIYNGQQINQVRTDLGKGSGIQIAGLVKNENSFCSTLVNDDIKNDFYNAKLGDLEGKKDHNLDGFRAFC